MKATFQTSAVLPLLAQAASVINAKNALPILDNFLIEGVDDNSVMVTASDSEIWLSIKIDMQNDIIGNLCINANNLVRALRNLDCGEVTVDFDNNTHIATFMYGASGYFKLPFLNDEFPKPSYNSQPTTEHGFTMSQAVLNEAIDNVSYAVAYDPLRPIMNGVHFDFHPNGLMTAATDMLRLARYGNDAITHCGNETLKLTLPSKAANILKTILYGEEDITLEFSDNNAVIKNTTFKFITRLIEGVYPNYNVVIPKSYECTACLNKNALLSAMKRVSPMGSNVDELVKLHFSNANSHGTLVVSAENIDFNTSAKETIMCEYEGHEIVIGIKSSVLIDTLRNINAENIWLEMTDATHAAVIHKGNKDNFLALVMPMAI